MKSAELIRLAGTICLGLALVLLSQAPALADPITFTWSGLPISGEAGIERPNFSPSGSAVFNIAGSTLTLTLTYTGSSEQIKGINQALSGLVWNITNTTVSLTPVSAMIPSGSSLIGVGAIAATNLSSEWAFRSNISAGSSLLGPIGSLGVGAVGDINFGADTFSVQHRFDTSTNLFGPDSLNGGDATIVGPSVDLTSDGFGSQGPVVQNSMVFTFNITGGTLTNDMLTDVQPLFGTEGAPLVPEPATLLLLGTGITMLAGGRFIRRR